MYEQPAVTVRWSQVRGVRQQSGVFWGWSGSNRATVEEDLLIFADMDGHGYDYADGDRDSYQIDYRRIVGDMEPARPRLSLRDSDHQFHGPFTHHTLHGHGHGHETAAQRYSATRIQAGFEPERWEHSVGLLIKNEWMSRSSWFLFPHVSDWTILRLYIILDHIQ